MLPQDDAAPKDGPPRLLVDAMLGRLARWLRLLGFDAEYWGAGSDDELIQAARAQGRLIVTRDHGLAGRRGVRALLIHAETLDEQIAEARVALTQDGAYGTGETGATSGGGAPMPFTRCPECNGELVELSHAGAEGLVPPYVWHTQRSFQRCTRCGRVFWKGTHYPGMQERLEPKS